VTENIQSNPKNMKDNSFELYLRIVESTIKIIMNVCVSSNEVIDIFIEGVI